MHTYERRVIVHRNEVCGITSSEKRNELMKYKMKRCYAHLSGSRRTGDVSEATLIAEAPRLCELAPEAEGPAGALWEPVGPACEAPD